jgi:hypothetical protein
MMPETLMALDQPASPYIYGQVASVASTAPVAATSAVTSSAAVDATRIARKAEPIGRPVVTADPRKIADSDAVAAPVACRMPLAIGVAGGLAVLPPRDYHDDQQTAARDLQRRHQVHACFPFAA